MWVRQKSIKTVKAQSTHVRENRTEKFLSWKKPQYLLQLIILKQRRHWCRGSTVPSWWERMKFTSTAVNFTSFLSTWMEMRSQKSSLISTEGTPKSLSNTRCIALLWVYKPCTIFQSCIETLNRTTYSATQRAKSSSRIWANLSAWRNRIRTEKLVSVPTLGLAQRSLKARSTLKKLMSGLLAPSCMSLEQDNLLSKSTRRVMILFSKPLLQLEKGTSKFKARMLNLTICCWSAWQNLPAIALRWRESWGIRTLQVQQDIKISGYMTSRCIRFIARWKKVNVMAHSMMNHLMKKLPSLKPKPK